MQFWGKIGQSNRLAHTLWWLATPPLGNPGSATEVSLFLDEIVLWKGRTHV